MEEDALLGMRHHLLCPISLQPMRDPVTSPAGISYDRRAIERWLAAGHATCPVTGQPLALADLTPNHTLRRLIQSYYHLLAATPDSSAPVVAQEQQPDDEAAADVVKKLFSVSSSTGSSNSPVDVLLAAAGVASRSDVARRYMVTAGVVPHVLCVLVSCARKKDMAAVEACLSLLRALLIDASGDDELRPPVAANIHDVVNALTAVLEALAPGFPGGDAARASAVQLLESAMDLAAEPVIARLPPELFAALTAAVRDRMSPAATRSALRALLRACHVPRNRLLAVEAGAAHEAIELELDAAASPSPSSAAGRRTTELALAVLAELCACAEGRAAVAAHPAGVAVVARRLLRVSAAADACAVRVLAAVAGRAAAPEVLREMARVGAVGKLCCVLQADCDAGVKDAARNVLRMHSGVWSGSPCVSAYLLSRYL